MAVPDERLTLGQALGQRLLNRQVQKILHHRVTVLGENALGMKLYPPDRQFPVAQTHDFPFFGFRSDLQTCLLYTSDAADEL